MSQGHAPLGTQKQKFRELLADSGHREQESSWTRMWNMSSQQRWQQGGPTLLRAGKAPRSSKDESWAGFYSEI